MIAILNFDRIAPFFRFILLVAFFIINDTAFSQTYGLKFHSHDVVLDKRTELNLTPNEFFNFRDEFEISFDYKIDLLKPNDYSVLFGYIFRIISQENNNVDLLITPTPAIFLNLVIGKSNSIIQVGSPNHAINNWINLRVKFLLNEDRLIFYTPDTFYVQNHIGLQGDDSFKIIFGANDYQNFKTSDVPSMCIKNIRIIEKGKLEYHWPLDEEKGNIANNRLSNKNAIVKNPSWIKNNHQAWEYVYQNELEGITLVTSDVDNGKFFLIGEREMLVYSAHENNTQTIKYRNKPPVFSADLKAIYNKLDKKIYCYVLDGKQLHSLNIHSGEWDEISYSPKSSIKSRHHNSFFYPDENSIYFFGGYGMHTYNNEIKKIDLTNNTWQELPSDEIIFPPRYLAGLGYLNDTLYLLGGYGSVTGSQMVNPHSYFDLVGYSIKNQTLFKKFEIPRLIDDMCVVNSIWIDKKNRNFYALVFEKMKFEGTLKLIKGNIDHPAVDIVGSTIPFKFQDIKSNAGLYYFPVQNRLFAYTTFAKDSSSTQIGIYSIDYPPNQAEFKPSTDHHKKNLSWFYLITGLIFLSGFSAWLIIRKRNTERKSYDTISANIISNENKFEESVSLLKQEKSNYQLVLFGGFQVFNLNNEEITNKFSPLLKELFLLILLHTYKNNKGISSDSISEILWFDKSEKSARNNRAVNIAKLRVILDEIGNCELTKKTGYWKILFEDLDIKCDFVDFLNITSSKNNLTKYRVSQLIDIAQKGGFLSHANYGWLDEFKASVSDRIVETLVDFGQKADIKTEADFIINLTECIFNFDIVNEEAMILKCRAQHYMGKHSQAKASYDKFSKEYLVMYNQEYEKSFLEILDIKE